MAVGFFLGLLRSDGRVRLAPVAPGQALSIESTTPETALTNACRVFLA